MSEIILPKGHLSFSQITLWLTARETYRQKYYPAVRPEYATSPEMAFGNAVTEAMERNEEWCAFLPRFQTFEFDISGEVDGVKVEAYIDNIDLESLKFREQKTGRTPWTMEKVMGHIQLDIYSVLLEERFKRPAEHSELVWAKTRRKKSIIDVMGHQVEAETSEIELTGEYSVFVRTISKEERAACREMIVRVGREIAEDYAALKHLYN